MIKYMNSLVREVNFNYILFPVEYVEKIDSFTLEMKFKSDLKKEYLKNCELVVDSTYRAKNDDGVIITDVDFTDYFKNINVSNNDFNDKEEYRKINIEIVDNKELPAATYRFIIAEKIDPEDPSKLCW